jgi:hypothetical protein
MVQIEEDGMVCACSTHEMRKAKRMLGEALNGRDKRGDAAVDGTVISKSGFKWPSAQYPLAGSRG